MTYFTSDDAILKEISMDLKQVGCCSRCILRYLGLSDMYFYRSDTQGMNSKVDEICKSDKETTNQPEEENVTNEAEKQTKMEDEDSAPENGVKHDSEDKPPDEQKKTEEAMVTESNDHEADAAKMEEQDSVVQNGQDGDNTTDDVKSTTGGSGGCVVCLGILDKFASVEFLNEVKANTAGYDYTTFMCSVMIPVCVILREHALMLYLKEKYPKLYAGKKYTDISTIKDVWKWRNGPVLKEILNSTFDVKSPFDITLTFNYKNSDQECNFLLSSDTDMFRKRKKDRRYTKKSSFTIYNRANVAKALDDMSEKDFQSQYQCPPRLPTCETICDIKCQGENVFVAGRYNKYSRILSQTPWFIEGVRKSESSVEELLATEINKYFKHSEQKFSSSGREDVDVLMLGNGRPFVMELLNPRSRDFTQEQMSELQQKINAATKDIRCTDLQIVSREDTERLKEGEIDKVKQYSALCWCKDKITNEKLQTLTTYKDLTVLQKTPIRVLHRRPLATRDRTVHSMTVEQIDDHHFKVGMATQAGTYIKEFVHGDFGRTKPNFSSLLGVDCDILELDVTAVELDWPKTIDVTG